MVERIYISEIQTMLHYKDRRSVRRWCRNNGIRILCDIGSNRQYVLKEEFEIAKNKVYNTNQNGFKSLVQLLSQKKNINAEKVNEYKPIGKYEISFLNCLQNI
jgi:hypothetical protein